MRPKISAAGQTTARDQRMAIIVKAQKLKRSTNIPGTQVTSTRPPQAHSVQQMVYHTQSIPLLPLNFQV
jgi:hypothetical protein